MGRRIARGARRRGVGLVILGIVLITAVAACGDSGGGIETAVPTATSAQTVETTTPSPTPKATQVAPTSTPSPTPPPAPKVEITFSRHTNTAEPPPGRLWLKGTITGVLTYEGDQALPAGSRILIWLRDHNDRYRAVGLSQPFEKSEQFPLPFAFHCDPCEVNEGQKYTASVNIEGPVDRRRQERSHWGVEFPDIQFLNASKEVVIDEKRFAENIEIPVVPLPILRGTIALGEGENIPPNASGYVRLLDVSEPRTEPVELSLGLIEATATFPKPFAMIYHPDDIDPHGTYVLQAELKSFRGRACHGLYRHKEVYEVITGDNPTHDVQLEIVQADKKGSGEVAHVTGTVTHANRYEDVEPDSSSEDGDTDPDGEDEDTDPHRVESDAEVSGNVRLSQKNILIYRPKPNPNIPWYLGIIDLSEDCTLAEVQIDSSMPLPFSFSIPFYSSHVDPDSDYEIRAYNFPLHGCGGGLGDERAIKLTPDNPGGSIELKVDVRFKRCPR